MTENIFNTYDRAKGYTSVDFRGDKALQSRELNDVQSLLQDQTKQVGDSLFRTGQIISGIDTSINSSKTAVTLSSGKVYVNGIIYDFSGGTTPLKGSYVEGVDYIEAVGVVLNTTQVTESDDPTLLDPDIGGENGGQPGALRTRVVLTIAVSPDPVTNLPINNLVVITRLTNGTVTPIPTDPFVTRSELLSILARRTFETNGNYAVTGLAATVTDGGTSLLNIQVSPGKAYVQGREVVVTQSTITVPTATETQTVLNEVKTFGATSAKAVLFVTAFTTAPGQLVRLIFGKRTGQDYTTTGNNNDFKIYKADGTYLGTGNLTINIPAANTSELAQNLPAAINSRFVATAPATTTYSCAPTNFTVGSSTYTFVASGPLGPFNFGQDDLAYSLSRQVRAIFVEGTQYQFLLSATGTGAATNIPIQVTPLAGAGGTYNFFTNTEDANAGSNAIVGTGNSDLRAGLLGGAGVLTFPLNSQPVKEIISLNANEVLRSDNLNHPIAGGADPIPSNFNPLTQIVKVQQGNILYERDVDYALTLGNNSVSWLSLVGSTEPATNSTYTLTYTYSVLLTQGTDFVLTGNSVDFSTSNGRAPAVYTTSEGNIQNTNFTVTYSFYLNRYDIIALDSTGALVRVPGQPAINPLPPIVPPELLNIATLFIPAGQVASGVSVLLTDRVNTFTMQDIKGISDRLLITQINQNTLEINQEAIKTANTTATAPLKGSLNDALVDLSKVDLGASGPAFTASIDTDRTAVTISQKRPIVHARLQYLPDSSPGTKPTRFTPLIGSPSNTLITLDYDAANPVAVRSQPLASEDVYLQRFINTFVEGTLEISPPRDFYFDNSSGGARAELRLTAQATSSAPFDFVTSNIGKPVFLTETLPEPFQRATTLTLQGRGLKPSQTLVVSFDGTPITVTSATVGTVGTGTIITDINGNFICQVTVPSNRFLPGLHKINVTNSTTGCFALWSSEPGSEANVSTTTGSTFSFDSIAQAFQVDQRCYVTAVDLFFSAKDSNAPVHVDIRKTVNGLPGGDADVLVRTLITPSSIVIPAASATGALPNPVATRVVFPYPVRLEPGTVYTITLKSDPLSSTSPSAHRMYLARVGSNDIATGAFISTQSDVVGKLFTSNSQGTWSVNQDLDLCYVVRAGNFVGNRDDGVYANLGTYDTAYLNSEAAAYLGGSNSPNSGFTGFKIVGEDEQFPGTQIIYQYYTNTDPTVFTTNINTPTVLSKRADAIYLRAQMFNNALEGQANNFLTPIIKLAGTYIQPLVMDVTGTSSYISRLVDYAQEYSNVYLSIQAVKPTGADIVPYYWDGNGNIPDWELIPESTLDRVTLNTSTGLAQYVYKLSGISAPLPRKFKIRIDLTATDPYILPYFGRVISFVY